LTAIIDSRTLLAVALTLTLTYAGLGRELPLDTTALVPFTSSLLLFVSYLYLMRSLIRLPFALVITIRQMRHARSHYGLDGRASLRDGFVRGFLDTRRWTVPPLASIDRLAVVGLTLLSTTPYLGTFLIRLGGLVGIVLMLLLYLFRGRFSFLVEDSLQTESRWTSGLPFLKTRDD
jgi:hypothetical protein